MFGDINVIQKAVDEMYAKQSKQPGKILPDGKAYACPKCSQPMQPEESNSSMSHCVPCQLSIDWWFPPDILPTVIDVPLGSVQAYNANANSLVITPKLLVSLLSDREVPKTYYTDPLQSNDIPYNYDCDFKPSLWERLLALIGIKS